jgi:peptidoglycan/xylan/chitin deacetylase (PgdA/CDA1 family)
MPLAITLLASSAALLPLAAGAAAYAALYPTSQLCGPVLVAPRRPHEFALTFDDGPNPTATPQLLDLLARHSIRATFFLIGENVRREPALTRRIAAAGHVIGNHTMTHPWLHLKSEALIRAELTGCNHALEDTLGTPVSLFRPPHGARRPAVLRIARSLGLTTVNWNLIANDWEPVPASIILSRISRAHRAIRNHGCATNLVLHDGGYNLPRLPTVEAVAGLVASLKDTTFVTPDTWLP